jgi:hypothetical protein
MAAAGKARQSVSDLMDIAENDVTDGDEERYRYPHEHQNQFRAGR